MNYMYCRYVTCNYNYIQFRHASSSHDELKYFLTRKRKPTKTYSLPMKLIEIRLLELDIIQRVSRIWHDYKFGSMFSKLIGEPDFYNKRSIVVSPSGLSALTRLKWPNTAVVACYWCFKTRVVSLFLIDCFKLYRNMYRNIMGIYIITACLSVADRAKSVNIYFEHYTLELGGRF